MRLDYNVTEVFRWILLQIEATGEKMACCLFTDQGTISMKTLSYRYQNFSCKDKTVGLMTAISLRWKSQAWKQRPYIEAIWTNEASMS